MIDKTKKKYNSRAYLLRNVAMLFATPGNASFQMAFLRAWSDARANQWDKKEKTKSTFHTFQQPDSNPQLSRFKSQAMVGPAASFITYSLHHFQTRRYLYFFSVNQWYFILIFSKTPSFPFSSPAHTRTDRYITNNIKGDWLMIRPHRDAAISRFERSAFWSRRR